MRMFLKSWDTCRVLAHGERTCICHTYGHRTLGDRGRLAPVRFWPLSACWLLCWSVAGGAGPGALERRNTGCILAPVRLAPVPFLPLSTCWLLCCVKVRNLDERLESISQPFVAKLSCAGVVSVGWGQRSDGRGWKRA